ncbi:MAG: DNA polymerase I, partial [Anaerorhabdus sp.]
MKKLLLVDGNSMLFRAFYATIYGRPMTTSTGLPTNAVYGFASMFQKALELVQPEAVLVAFDSGKHTFRHDIFEDYKGGRKETPEELVVQFGLVRDYLDAYHVKRCELTSIEADDIIGTMSKKYPDWDINILSSDRDLLQLI